MSRDNTFSKIIHRKVPADIIYQDELVTVFNDINPKTPVHVLIVPNIVIATSNDILPEHEKILGRMFIIAVKIAKLKNISDNGYRLIINCNKHGGQEIKHMHMHLLGGCQLGPII